MAVLITGGYGLLGSWLALEFAKDNDEVIIVDVVQMDLDYLQNSKNKLQYEHASVLDFPRLVEIFRHHGNKIDGIIHTVAMMATPHFWAQPHQGIYVNIMGTVNMLEIARLFHIRKFLFVSSGAVYGEQKESARETTHYMRPSDLYGASKASAELLGQQYENHYDIDFRCVRPFFFFGPGKFPSEMPFLFKNLLGPLEGLTDLKLEKGADQRLGFTYVKDTARGTYLLYRAENPQQKTMNISSDVPVSFKELVRLSKTYSDIPTDVIMGPGKLFPRGETLDISIAREELGFHPKYSAEEGMKEYAEWIRDNRKRKNRVAGI
jgi:nucleoside-diphosphate-sugar epimerase